MDTSHQSRPVSQTTAITPSQNRARMSPSDRAEQLLRAAITIYSRMGVERAGHGDVAKLAGVSTATVFNYFPTREALTRAVLAEVERVTLSVFETADDGQTGRAKMMTLIGRLDANITARPDIIKVFLNWSVSFGDSVRPQFLGFQDALLNRIHSQLFTQTPQGKPGERAQARILLGAATTFAMMRLDNSDSETIQTFVARVAQVLDA